MIRSTIDNFLPKLYIKINPEILLPPLFAHITFNGRIFPPPLPGEKDRLSRCNRNFHCVVVERRARERKRKRRAALASGKPFANVSSKLRQPDRHALEYALVPVYERRDTETEAGDDHGRIGTAKSRDSFSRISLAREPVCISPSASGAPDRRTRV